MQRADVLGTSVLIAALAVGGAAEQQANVVRAPRPPVRLQTLSPSLRLSGIVITREQPPKPVSGLTIRTRDRAGRVVGTEKTDAAGRFVFALEKPGSYFVEAVDSSGRVLAVEDVGLVSVAVSPGQDATTILRVPVPRQAGTWTSTAATILGAASAAGVGAFAASGQAASPEQ